MGGKFLPQAYRVVADQYTKTYPEYNINHISLSDHKDSLGVRIADKWNNVYTVVKCMETWTDGAIVALQEPVAEVQLHTGATLCPSEIINSTTYYHSIYLTTGATAGTYNGYILAWDTDGATIDATYEGEFREILHHPSTHIVKISRRDPTINRYDGNALTTAPTTSAVCQLIAPHHCVLADATSAATSIAHPVGVAVGAGTAGEYALIMSRGYYRVQVGDCSANTLAAYEAICSTATAGRGDGVASALIVGYALHAYDDAGTGVVLAYIDPIIP